MTLAPGVRVGPYEIAERLGVGGMGEVWRARDARLGRDVAIKALPESFGDDPDRLARFEREARLLASVSHPNIAGIHGIEESAGQRFLVLECVEGETLAERLARGPLPLDEALDVARQVAAAVEAAHEGGVIHRDLKPANVKLTPAGQVKVLDFGLAKGPAGPGSPGVPGGLSQSPTMLPSMTAAGMILGTAAYMSPEQARGKTVDRRTDIWSFGCILFECLTGAQLFEGETVSDLIARILEREPDWSRLPPRLPSKVRDLLGRCLDKDPKRRMRDIGDARIELEEAIATRATATASDPGRTVAPPPRPAARAALPWALAGVFAVAVVLLALPRLRPTSATLDPIRFAITAPAGTTLASDAMECALSPDGRTLAFVATDSSNTGHLWLRRLDELVPRLLAGTENADLPFWSPDGRWVGFFADSKLKRIPVGDGAVEMLADANNGRGGTMNREGAVVFAPAGGGPLFKIAHPGDTAQPATSLDSTRHQNSHRYPCFLPDGRHFIYAALPPRQGRYEIFAGSLDGGTPVRIGAFDACPIYVNPGFLIYLRGKTIVAQRFDAGSLRTRGEPVPLGETPAPSNYAGAPCVAASQTGTIASLNGSLPNTDLVVSERASGRTVPVPVPRARYDGVGFSPDARQIVCVRIDDRVTQDVWTFDRDRRTLTRLTFGAGYRSNPIWSPDGGSIAYASNQEGPFNIYVRALGGAGTERAVFSSPTPFKYPCQWSFDGRSIVVEALEEKTGWDLWTAPVGGGSPTLYLRTPFNERWGAISPDGRWMAYSSDESGKWEVYVQSFPVAGEKHQVSTQGGFTPAWRKDGREVGYYTPDGSACMVVEVKTEPGFSAGEPHVILKVPPGVQSAAITPGFDAVLEAVPTASDAPSSLNLLVHWDALLEPSRAPN